MNQMIIYVSCGEGREIDVFAFDPALEELRQRQRVPTSGMAVPMRVSPGRLYAGLRSENALLTFSIDPNNGQLTALGEIAAPGAPVYLSCDMSRRVVFAASYGDNNLSVFPMDAAGVALTACQTERDLPRAHAARLDATHRWLLVPTLGVDAIRIYRMNDDLRVVPNDPPVILGRPGSGPRHPVFSSDNRFVYCLNELDGTIDAFGFDAQCGALALKQTINMMPPGFDDKPWTAELRLRPDGRFLYATDRRSSTLAVLAVDTASGGLTLIDHVLTEIQPRGMDIDPSGRWLVVAGQQSAHVTVYAIDPASGCLRACQRYETGKDPICVEIVTIQPSNTLRSNAISSA